MTCEILRCLSRGWSEIPGLPSVCLHNVQTKAWNLRPGMSLWAESINGRVNDRLITTPTKPGEHNPQGAEGVQLHAAVTALWYFMPCWLQILDFMCRVSISLELNIASVNKSRIRGHTQAICRNWKEWRWSLQVWFKSKPLQTVVWLLKTFLHFDYLSLYCSEGSKCKCTCCINKNSWN